MAGNNDIAGRMLETFGCLIANGLLSETECIAAMGSAAVLRGFQGDKRALAAGIRSRLRGGAVPEWERRRRVFQTDSSDVIASMFNQRRPSREILRAVQRLNMTMWDGLPPLSSREIDKFVEEEIGMLLAAMKAKAQK